MSHKLKNLESNDEYQKTYKLKNSEIFIMKNIFI